MADDTAADMTVETTNSPLAFDLRVGCKINLSLRITGRRPDGWHELDTLFMALPAPCDGLRGRVRGGVRGIHRGRDNASGTTWNNDGRGLVLTCAASGLDCTRNTLTRAYAAYAQATGFAPDLDVELIKGVPMGAGLGGGSADAAALLLALQRLAVEAGQRPLALAELTALATGVGADVPFFLRAGIGDAHGPVCAHGVEGGTIWRARGLGEILSPAPLPKPLHGRGLLLLCPPVAVPTPWAFGAWDAAQAAQGGGAFVEPSAESFVESSAKPSPKLAGGHVGGHVGGQAGGQAGGQRIGQAAGAARRPLSGHGAGKKNPLPVPAGEGVDLTGFGARAIDAFPREEQLENDFESVVFARFPELLALKVDLLREGALGAVMSGSGASIFGIFADADAAGVAWERFQARGMTAYSHALAAF